jgi:uncharacterized protein (TIGR02996 family)
MATLTLTEARLIEAVHENPADDTAREVLADWFEQHGDHRAEYLRLEIQLQRSPDRSAELFPQMNAWWRRALRGYDFKTVHPAEFPLAAMSRRLPFGQHRLTPNETTQIHITLERAAWVNAIEGFPDRFSRAREPFEVQLDRTIIDDVVLADWRATRPLFIATSYIALAIRNPRGLSEEVSASAIVRCLESPIDWPLGFAPKGPGRLPHPIHTDEE